MSGLGLAFAIGAWWDGHPQYLAMAINVVAVFYLNQREVRSVFDAGSEDDDAVARARGRVVIDAADLELLRRHEPILRFTRRRAVPPDADRRLRRGLRPAVRARRCAKPRVVDPGGQPTLDAARRRRRPAARAPPVPPLRARAAERGRARAAGGTGRTGRAFSGAGPAGAGRAAGPARRRRARHVAPAARPRPGRHRGRGRPALRRDPRARSAGRLPRPRRPRGRAGSSSTTCSSTR